MLMHTWCWWIHQIFYISNRCKHSELYNANNQLAALQSINLKLNLTSQLQWPLNTDETKNSCIAQNKQYNRTTPQTEITQTVAVWSGYHMIRLVRRQTLVTGRDRRSKFCASCTTSCTSNLSLSKLWNSWTRLADILLSRQDCVFTFTKWPTELQVWQNATNLKELLSR